MAEFPFFRSGCRPNFDFDFDRWGRPDHAGAGGGGDRGDACDDRDACARDDGACGDHDGGACGAHDACGHGDGDHGAYDGDGAQNVHGGAYALRGGGGDLIYDFEKMTNLRFRNEIFDKIGPKSVHFDVLDVFFFNCDAYGGRGAYDGARDAYGACHGDGDDLIQNQDFG